MKPKQKYRLLVLAIVTPYLLLLIYGLATHRKWLVLACSGYGIAALVLIVRYLLTHPELRPTQEEGAKRLTGLDPRRAKLVTISSLFMTLLACSIYLAFVHEPLPGMIRTQGFQRAHTFLSFTRGAAWTLIGLTIALFARVWQVAYRKSRKSGPALNE